MSLYPSLEKLTIGKEINAQQKLAQSIVKLESQIPGENPRANYQQLAASFLGLDLSSVRYDDFGNAVYVDPSTANKAVVTAPGFSIERSSPATATGGAIVKRDPIDIVNGVREITVCKDRRGFLGIQLRELDAGLFVTYVERESSASVAGLRFGDQVLRINSVISAGMSGPKAMNLLQLSPNRNNFIIRDRPLERTILLHKDSRGSVGIAIKHGKVSQIVKDSSAARNGVLVNHQILEVNGRNVIGLKDINISNYIDSLGSSFKMTVIPSFFFDHMVRRLGHSSMMKMDRSVPLV